MKIELDYIVMKNFKGIEKFKLELGGKSAVVAGRNATGKTTIADAFFWVISDSTSENKSQFNPISETALKKPPAYVELGLKIDSKLHVFTKKHIKKFTKKRGKSTSEFTGHTTEYSIDKIPLKKNEYQEKIAGFFDPNLIRCLTDVRFFCGFATTEYRRRVLLDMVGDLDVKTILDDNLQLYPLAEYFEGMTCDEMKKLFLSQKREAEKTIIDLPARIDELKKSIIETEPLETIISKINQLKIKLAESTNEIDLVKLRKITELKYQIEERHHARNRSAHEVERLQMVIESDNRRIEFDREQIDRLDKLMTQNEQSRKDLKKNYDQVKMETIGADNRNCKLCGQLLTPDQILEMIENFKKDKQRKIDMINEAGIRLKKQYIEFSNLKAGKLAGIEQLNQIISETKAKIDAMPEPDPVDTTELENRIAEIEKGILPAEDTTGLQAELTKLEKLRIYIDLQTENQNRIAELETRLQCCAGDLETAEKNLYLLTEFERLKNEYLESRINQLFNYTRFRLFETQINNGIRPICEASVAGIGFNSGLNTGAKINAGLDCINALSNHYGITAPVIIDNAESVTDWIDTNRQMIRLTARENVKTLISEV